MKSSHLIVLLFVFLAGVVALTFHLFKNETSEIGHLSHTLQQTLQVKQYDILLSENALKAASFKTVHFDDMVHTVKSLSALRKSLAQALIEISESTTPPLKSQIDTINEEVEKRVSLIEQLKAKVALARNSSNFLLRTLRDHSQTYGLEASALALRALNELQGYQIFPTEERFEKTAGILKLLKQQSVKGGKENNLGNALRHMEVSFEGTQKIAEILKELQKPDSQDAINKLIKTLQDIQTTRQHLTEGYLFLLSGIAIATFIALSFVFARWVQAREKIHKTSQLFQDAVESMSEGFAFFGPDERLVFWNSNFEDLYSTLEGGLETGMSLLDFEDIQKDTGYLVLREPQTDGSSIDLTRDGRWMLSSNTAMKQGGYALVRVDLTEQKKAQEQLHLAATVFQTASEAMMVTDREDHIEMVNPAFSDITGYSEAEVIGKTPHILSSGRHDEHYYHKMFEELKRHGTWQGEIWNRRKSGEVFPEWLSITTIYDDEGIAQKRISLFTDITSRKKSEERIHYQANYDSLTDLPNRNLFKERLTQSINAAKRNKDTVALLFLDLDNFKHINDTLGHLMGDELLRHVADRLRSLFSASDTIARLSGDEFIVIINEANDMSALEQVLDQILECLQLPYLLNGNTTYTSVSVGATLYPRDGTTVDSLLQNADAAMFKAKDQGRNTYCFFTPEMNSRAKERHEMEVALHGALDKGHFVLHYQPIIDLASQTIKSTESLVRWNDPERGLVPPIKFIPIAEDTGLIVPMGEWILRQACHDAAQWNIEKGLDIGVSVNLSSRQFKRSDIFGLVRETLQETKLPVEQLTLEITESLLVDDDSGVLKTLRQIRDLGVKLSIDDFGTGYSSLSYLKRFPITILKIDQSFINGVLHGGEDAALTEAILSMARSLGLKVVAEGVESQGQNDFLFDRDCDYIQGFHYSRPVPVADLMHAIENKKLKAKTKKRS
ncbi:MAG: EAL domain-containing protein [Methylocystaceae bacterium]|nr:EAL domain-containing protein [Methylocystaceae bacterium]